MTFDDRLRGHLRRQAADVHVDAIDHGTPRRRAGRRRLRRNAGGFAVVFAVLGAGVAWVAIQSQDDPVVELATETENATEVLEPAAETGSADGEVAEEVEEPVVTAGPPLVFTEIDSAGAPGGFNLHSKGAAGDLYYVLSTAPGATEEEVYGAGPTFRTNDTLYTWRGDGWAATGMPERFITTIGDHEGLLY
ncbi:MAG: hypothetical protein AAF480_15990, partial [Actinomycetota bacterium]